MSKQSERRNKMDDVNWPKTAYFTIDDIFQLNSDWKTITLRVRLTKRIEQAEVVEIGCKTGGQGRPRKVFAFTPVSPATLELAKSKGINLVDQNKLQKLSTVPPVVTPVLFGAKSTVSA